MGGGVDTAILSHVKNLEHCLKECSMKGQGRGGDGIISVVWKGHRGTIKCFVICEIEKGKICFEEAKK